MIEIQRMIIPENKKPKFTVNGKETVFSMIPEYITIHETANTAKGANDLAHANLQKNGNARDASWHLQVDEDSCYQSLDFNEAALHAGDGLNGTGNRKSIAIEICVNSDGNFEKAVKNAADIVKFLMKKYNISIMNVVQHNKWSGKDCPRFLRNGSKGIDWNDFIGMLKNGESPSVSTSKPQPTKSHSSYSVVDYMNSKNMDSSYPNRAKLAAKYGIKGYEGSPEQNLKLLDKLKSEEKKPAPKPSKKADMKTNSIIDYLDSIDVNSSFSNRAKLAKANGISGYEGSEEQNLKLLGILRDGKPKVVASKPASKYKAIGEITIVGVSNAAIVQDQPDRLNSKSRGTIGKGEKLEITGSVHGKNSGTGYWEVIYKGKLGYVTGVFGKYRAY
jgi:N-acetylmuramoyl-L-alanine amidase